MDLQHLLICHNWPLYVERKISIEQHIILMNKWPSSSRICIKKRYFCHMVIVLWRYIFPLSGSILYICPIRSWVTMYTSYYYASEYPWRTLCYRLQLNLGAILQTTVNSCRAWMKHFSQEQLTKNIHRYEKLLLANFNSNMRPWNGSSSGWSLCIKIFEWNALAKYRKNGLFYS